MIPIKDINPTRRFPAVTLALIGMNSAVFLYQLTLGPLAHESFLHSYALVPARLLSGGGPADGLFPAGATVMTSLFLHGGFLHVTGNMLYLWIFGNNVEDSMGPARFILFYFLCGTLAAFSHAFTDASSMIPMIGASGAVSGVLGAYLLLFPRARVLTVVPLVFLIRTVEIPAMFVLGFWFLFQFLNALVTSGQGGGIAWYAHLGGFAAGVMLIGIFKRKDVPFWGGRRYRYP